jgi:uncharacterized membrane protein YdjX (TVP38/TMEM64 family)
MSRSTLLRLFGLAVLVAIIAAAYQFRDEVPRLLQWLEDLGPWGPVLLAAAYVPATVLAVPGSLITLGAGAAFGVVPGTVAVSVGSTLGAAAAFLIGRTLARGWVERKVAGNPRFRAIDQAIGREGFKIVLLLRLSPVFPFNLLNYALGLTSVSFRSYLLASWIGMLPATVMYVYLGSALGSLARVADGRGERSPAEKGLFYGGLAATVVVTILITRLARRALSAAVPLAEVPPAAGPINGAGAERRGQAREEAGPEQETR